MKRVIDIGELEWENRVLSVNSGNKGQGCYREILLAIAGQMEAMLSYHSRVFVTRFDLHLSEYKGDNRLLSRFMDKLKRHLLGVYGMKRIGFIWAREQEKAKQHHYHVALLLDGNKIRTSGKLLDWIDEKWQQRNQPKVYVPKNCFYMVKRASSPSFDKAFYRLSYLAKKRGKGYRPNAVNDYSTSRIKPRVIL